MLNLKRSPSYLFLSKKEKRAWRFSPENSLSRNIVPRVRMLTFKMSGISISTYVFMLTSKMSGISPSWWNTWRHVTSCIIHMHDVISVKRQSVLAFGQCSTLCLNLTKYVWYYFYLVYLIITWNMSWFCSTCNVLLVSWYWPTLSRALGKARCIMDVALHFVGWWEFLWMYLSDEC